MNMTVLKFLEIAAQIIENLRNLRLKKNISYQKCSCLRNSYFVCVSCACGHVCVCVCVCARARVCVIQNTITKLLLGGSNSILRTKGIKWAVYALRVISQTRRFAKPTIFPRAI